MDHYANSGGSWAGYSSHSWEMERRIREIEDRLGITAEREKVQRAKRYQEMRQMVLDRKKARAEGTPFYKTRYGYTTGLPKEIWDKYNNMGDK